MLILPAFTLEKTKAAEQGGIDVPGVTTTAEDVSGEDADANDGQTDAQDVQTESVKTEDGKAEDSGSKSKDSGEANADSEQTADPLTFEDEHYTIAVDDKNSVLPENTEIKVEEIDKNEDAKKYQKHFDDALAAIQEEKDGENVSDLEFARFYDISLVSDGKEVTLGSGDKVSVNIEYDKELRKALGVENKDNIRIIHFAENKDTGKVEAEVLDNKEAKVTAETTEDNLLKEAAFDAESFSVYGLVYVKEAEEEAAQAEEKTEEAAANSEIDLGTAVVSTVDGSDLPEDVDGHADVVTGKKAIAAVEKKVDDIDADKTEYKVFDIALENVDESEYKDGFKVDVTLPEEIKGKDFRLFHIHDGKVEELDVQTNGSKTVDGFTFETENFSQFVLSYTVDFEYNGLRFSIDGGGKIKLSDLFKELNIEKSVKDVESVTFSNPELVKVSHREGFLGIGEDWILESLQPFTSEETLTIKFEDGEYIEIEVTDDQASTDLKNYLTSVAIDAPQNEKGEYVINPGDSYSIRLDFAENKNLQFPNGGSMTYEIPEGLIADGVSGSFSISVKTRQGTVIIPNNTYSVENGILTFNWSTDPSVETLFAQNNARFNITMEATFDGSQNHIEFSDSISKDVVVDTSNSVTVSKTANVDKQNNKLWYTVSVHSNGNSKNVKLSDVLSGTGISLDRNSFSATSSTGRTVGASLEPGSGNSFVYDLGDMSNGEYITVRYAANIDTSTLQKINGKTMTVADNTAKVVSDGDPTGDSQNVKTEIDYTPSINKSGATITGDTDDGKKILNWTITYNPEAIVPASGDTITDKIKDSSQSIMSYHGDGVYVTVYNKDGTIARAKTLVPWSDLNKTSSSWVYTIPATDTTPYKYVITYDTEVDASNLTQITAVENDVKTSGGKSGSGSGQVGPQGGSVEVHKTADKVDVANREVTWTATFTVPENGLEKAVITDTHPNLDIWVDTDGDGRDDTNKHWYDVIDENSVVVDGLVGGEDKQIDVGTTNTTITFTNNGSPGLKGTGETRVITVTFKTKIDEEWLKLSANDKYSYIRGRTNNISLDVGAKVYTANASTSVTAPKVNKTASLIGTRTVDGVELPIYQYKVELFGVEQDVNEIVDTFDTDLLEVYKGAANNFWLYVGNEYHPYWDGIGMDSTDTSHTTGVPATYLTNEDGITIYTSASSLKKGYISQNPDSYYPVYGLVYYLTVKDEAALNRMIGRAVQSEDGTYVINNTAEWNGQTGTGSVTYKYQGLTKEILTEDKDLSKTDEEIYADFRITLNPAAQVLNDMQPLTMTDDFENLSVMYDSIQADPPNGVTWDFSGNTATFTIPDATKVVITYRARIVRSADGTRDIHFSNVARMEGFKDSIEKTAHYTSDAGGAASEIGINLMKYTAGDMNDRLEGAVFALYEGKTDASGKPIYDDNGNPIIDLDKPVRPVKTVDGQEVYGPPVTFTTDENGMIAVYGDNDKDGWSVYEETWYFLREIRAPEGHMLAGFDYSFYITKDGTTDYARYIYHTDDTMSAKNYPGTDVKVSKAWSDGNDNHPDDTVTVKLQQKIEGHEWSDSIRMEVKQADGSYEWQDVASKTLDLSADNDWEGTFASLPIVVPASLDASAAVGDDVSAEYRVVESLVNGSAPEEGTYTVTRLDNEGGSYVFSIANTVESQTGNLKISKEVKIDDKSPSEISDATTKSLADGTYTFEIWDENAEHKITEKADGSSIGTLQITISNGEADPSELLVEGLTPGTYVVKEVNTTNKTTILDHSSRNYDADLDGIVVNVAPADDSDVETAAFVNKYETTSATVKKEWNVKEDEISKIPDSLQVTLLSDGAVTDNVVTLDSDNNWTDTISNLPKRNENGNVIEYTWLEGYMPEGFYLSNSSAQGTVTTFTNSLSDYDLVTSYVGVKKWDDFDNKYNKRPDNLVITLFADYHDGRGRQPLNNQPQWEKDKASNQWTYTFTNLPVFSDEGNIIDYSVEETEPSQSGYLLSDTSATETKGTIGTISYEDGQRVTENNKVHWELGSLIDLAYVAIKPTGNGDVVVWTHRHPTPAERTAISNLIKGEKDPLNGCRNRNIVFYSGTGNVHTPHGDVTVTYDPEDLGVVLDFGTEDVWAHFIVGQFKTGSEYYAGTTEFTNTITKDFEFTKVWEDGEGQSAEWPEGKTITVNFNASTTDEEKALTDQPLTFSPTNVPEGWTVTADSTNKKYTFKTTGLAAKKDGKELTYYVVESKVDGYKDPAYADASGHVQTNVNNATDGQQVINTPEDAVELPHTGGIGTVIFYVLGSILVIGGGIYFISRRRAMK